MCLVASSIAPLRCRQMAGQSQHGKPVSRSRGHPACAADGKLGTGRGRAGKLPGGTAEGDFIAGAYRLIDFYPYVSASQNRGVDALLVLVIVAGSAGNVLDRYAGEFVRCAGAQYDSIVSRPLTAGKAEADTVVGFHLAGVDRAGRGIGYLAFTGVS